MHPDLPYAVARSYQHDLNIHAREARKAAKLEHTDREVSRFRLPRIEFSRRVGAVRIRIAHT